MTQPARYLQVTFAWDSTPKVKELVPLFDTAIDWARLTPNCWVLWTTSTPEVWMRCIKPHLGESDFVYIVEVNFSSTPQTFTGWAPEWFWKWIQKGRVA